MHVCACVCFFRFFLYQSPYSWNAFCFPPVYIRRVVRYPVVVAFNFSNDRFSVGSRKCGVGLIISHLPPSTTVWENEKIKDRKPTLLTARTHTHEPELGQTEKLALRWFWPLETLRELRCAPVWNMRRNLRGQTRTSYHFVLLRGTMRTLAWKANNVRKRRHTSTARRLATGLTDAIQLERRFFLKFEHHLCAAVAGFERW